MSSRNMNNRNSETPRNFLDMLSTISLEEILILECRQFGNEKWQNMILLQEKEKKKYQCNVCNVVQYGDKNLFSHLSGKRHNSNMTSVSQMNLNNKRLIFQSQTNNSRPAAASKPTPKLSPKVSVEKKSDTKNIRSTTSANIQINTKSASTSTSASTAKKPEVKESQPSTSEKAATANNPQVKQSQQPTSAKSSTLIKPEVKQSQPSTSVKASTANKPEVSQSQPLTSVKASTANKPEVKESQPSTSVKPSTANKPEVSQSQPLTSVKASTANKPEVKESQPTTLIKAATANKPEGKQSQQSTSGISSTSNKPEVKQSQPSTSVKASTANKPEVKQPQQPTSGKSFTANKPEVKQSQPLTSVNASTANKPEVKQTQPSTSVKPSVANKPEVKQSQPSISVNPFKANKPEVKQLQQSNLAGKSFASTKAVLKESQPVGKDSTATKLGVNESTLVKSSTANKPGFKESQQSSSGKSATANRPEIKESQSKNNANDAKKNNKNNNSKQTATKISDKDKTKNVCDAANESQSKATPTPIPSIIKKTAETLSIKTGPSAVELVNQHTEKTNGNGNTSEVVKNPFSSVVKTEKTIISCVPLSKLLSTKPENIVDNNEIEVINLSDTETLPSNTQELPEIDKSVRSDKNERHHHRELIPAITSGDKRNDDKKVVEIFESQLNPHEIHGLLGVEYVIKIIKSQSERNARYQCSLCDITTDQAAMQKHLVGYNHMLKYCEKHFPTAMAQYRQYIVNVPEHKVCKVLMPILRKLAIAIETHHGRADAFLCYDYTYQKNKQTIISKVMNRKHSSEMSGPSFIHVVDANEVDILIENARKKVVQQPPPADYVINPATYFNSHYQEPYRFNSNCMPNNYINNFPVENNMEMMMDDETHKRMVENFLRGNKHGQSHEHKTQNRTSKRPRSRSNSMDRKKRRKEKMATQWNVERRSLSPLREGDIWQAYRHMVDQKIRELNESFELYKSDPEQHPQYQEEWQKFWKRRKDELIASGINHRTYNYQNEWVLFFNARIEELYNQDVENIKIKCRERLCLPMTNDDLPNPKYHVHVIQDAPPVLETAKVGPAEEERYVVEQTEEDVNVIHVLRLLTAMEDNLGSLGPLITEMLGKALQLQKIHPDKLNSMVLNVENCAILETAKEKFTGLVISKILDPNKERAVKRAIKETDQLLKSITKMNQKSPNVDMNLSRTTKMLNTNVSKQSVNISDKLDMLPNSSLRSNQVESSLCKTELAAKLASSLISQGKTSINREQLQQIMQVYSMIEKKKRLESSNTTNTTETYTNSVEMPSKQNQPPTINYQEHVIYENNRNPQNTALGNYQELSDPIYNSSGAAGGGGGGSIYDNSSGIMNNMNNFQANGNYSSANVARMNYTNYNNPNMARNYFNNRTDVGSRPNYYEKTDGEGHSIYPYNNDRSNMDEMMMSSYHDSNPYNNVFGPRGMP